MQNLNCSPAGIGYTDGDKDLSQSSGSACQAVYIQLGNAI